MTEFKRQVWKAFGTSVREVRESREMTQADLSLRLSRFGPKDSQSAIAKLERGDHLVSIDKLAALSWILGVEVDRLLPRVVSRQDQQGDAAAIQAELDELTTQRAEMQRRWDRLTQRLLALDTIPEERVVLVPEGGDDVGQHHEEA